MNEDNNDQTAANNESDVNDWIADLEQTFIKEDLALKHTDDAAKNADEQEGQGQAQPDNQPHDKHSGKKNKKNKKPFRFF